MRKRPRNIKQNRAGVIAVEQACNQLDLIWRNLLEEDVGVDGTIEISLGEFPTGKIVGVQIKSGMSYIRSETEDGFTFYPDADDITYWLSLSIPLVLLVHHPDNNFIYWVDVHSYYDTVSAIPPQTNLIKFDKANKLDQSFESYLHSRFDLQIYTNQQYLGVKQELEGIVHLDGSGVGAVTITALDLFIEGLWGLCSKVKFHSSLLTDLIRTAVSKRDGESLLSYTFSRDSLYKFFSGYFNILIKHKIAALDIAEVNESMYLKLEYPTFISALTTNGRKFVEYLRESGVQRVHDNQYMSLEVRPHLEIEVYSDFSLVDGRAIFGHFTDVIAIEFNAHLDYYHLQHWHRSSPDERSKLVAEQNIYYYALRDYIRSRFDSIPKENLLFRYKDIPVSPLICWLEEWNDNQQPISTEQLRGDTVARRRDFASELMSILPGVATMGEPLDPPFPSRLLANGEQL